MCTATWMRTADGYHVFFNRDESRRRAQAEPAAPRSVGPARFLAPIDGDHGGTWIAVNPHGVTVFLHNGYAAVDRERSEPPGGFTSRGLLVAAVAGSRSAAQVWRRLAHHDPARFRTFLLVAFDADGRPGYARWDGSALATHADLAPPMPLVSSSFRKDEVTASRTVAFRDALAERPDDPLTAHLAFHAAHVPRRGACSPCMHRPDAHTVSFSWITVATERVSFRYTPRSPCRGLILDEPVELPRIAAPD